MFDFYRQAIEIKYLKNKLRHQKVDVRTKRLGREA